MWKIILHNNQTYIMQQYTDDNWTETDKPYGYINHMPIPIKCNGKNNKDRDIEVTYVVVYYNVNE